MRGARALLTTVSPTPLPPVNPRAPPSLFSQVHDVVFSFLAACLGKRSGQLLTCLRDTLIMSDLRQFLAECQLQAYYDPLLALGAIS